MWDLYSVEIVARCRREDYLREAARERLCRAARGAQRRHRRLDRQLARWAGTHLVRWGVSLQAYALNPRGNGHVSMGRRGLSLS